MISLHFIIFLLRSSGQNGRPNYYPKKIRFLIIFFLDANFDPKYLARLFTDSFEILRSDNIF